jgi:hypothetical protein
MKQDQQIGHPLPAQGKQRGLARARQDAPGMFDAHEGCFWGISLIGGQTVLAVVLWWLRLGWFGVMLWVGTGVLAGMILVVGHVLTGEQDCTQEGEG